MRKDDGTAEVTWAIKTAFPQIPHGVVRGFVALMRRANRRHGGA